MTLVAFSAMRRRVTGNVNAKFDKCP